GAELGLKIPDQVARNIRALLSNQAGWNAFRAQDLGMLLIGVVAQAKAGEKGWASFGEPLFRLLEQRFQGDAGLFFDAAIGPRRRFASFATQTYLSIACYHYGEFAGD